MPLDENILDIIVCPRCKGDLEYDRDKSRLICGACCLAYPIKDDIPIMLENEAERVD